MWTFLGIIWRYSVDSYRLYKSFKLIDTTMHKFISSNSDDFEVHLFYINELSNYCIDNKSYHLTPYFLNYIFHI